jgi:hypothetical protein
MKGIRYDVNGSTLIFGPEGDVAQLVNGNTVIVGSWQSQSAQRDNKIQYDINGQAQTPIPCQYSFNMDNQLVAALQRPDGTLTDPFTFIGSIEVDETTDVIYTLITGEGAPMTRNVIVYGSLTFDSSNFLSIALAGGGTARIRGDGGAQAIDALANLSDPDPSASDLLVFNASTVNLLATGKKKSYPANINIKGNWDLADNSLVFMAAGDTSQIKIGFAGKFKGVAAGFAYTTDSSGAKIGFVVAGQHTWNSGSANWDVVVGFSQNTFQANLTGAVQQTLPNGAIAIQGTLNVLGNNISFDFNVQARYSFNDANMLIFNADVQTGGDGSVNYDLQLEGTFKFDGLALAFDAKMSNAGSSITITLATSGNQSLLQTQLSLTLDIAPGGQVNLSFTFTLSMHFVNGQLVKDAPQPKPQAQPQPPALAARGGNK